MSLSSLKKLHFVPLMIAALWSANGLAQEWPKEMSNDVGTITIYQPQPESLNGNKLTARAAMSIRLKDSDEPIFGAFWFTANVETDSDAGLATVRDLEVSRVRWPESKDAGEQRFSAAVENAAEGHKFEISLEELSASLATAETQAKSLENLKNDPPIIVFKQELGVLVLFDGAPMFSAVENSDYERALNTPMVVVRNTKSKRSYLSSGTLWYEANDPMGPWSATSSPPSDLVSMLPAPDATATAPAKPPLIVTASQPTELISTDGSPSWASLAGGKILYVENTESPWLRELSTGNMYILLSGRWFRSKAETGPWTFVRADELPQSFKEIPPDSDIGGLRVSVAGTKEAQDAMLDAQIPQTAAIKRDEASLAVEYDGTAQFDEIPGTKVSYAVNTGAQVLLVEGLYYAVDNGVWFTSKSATGPWAVADSIPKEEIDKIPPDSPMYNTTYVTIYESTPEVVYVGYTPGYMWSYPYYGVPVYGTGWYYPPYYGRYYYPRPPTWGFHVGYNPWTGWNFGVSWSNGFLTMGVRWGGGYGGGYYPGRCCGGRYGGGYHGGNTIINTGDINIGNNVSVGNRNEVRNRIGNDNNLGGGDRANIYNRPENSRRNADSQTARRDLQQARPATNKANNVYADRDGNVARNNNGNWETRDQGSWKSESRDTTQRPTQSRETSQRDNTRQSPSSFDRNSMDRASQSRQHGASRAAARPTGGGRRRR